MLRSKQKEVIVLEPNPSRFDLIQEALQAIPNPPGLWHFSDQDSFWDNLPSIRPSHTAFLLIDAELAQQNAGKLLDQLSGIAAYQFVPIVISCSFPHQPSPCLPDDPRVNARVQWLEGSLSFQQKIVDTFNFWVRVNITI